jgi:hemerythrin-like metal-binding protein
MAGLISAPPELEELEAQHRGLQAEIRELLAAPTDRVLATISLFQQHAASHFAWEELVMRDALDPERGRHRREHRALLEGLDALAERLRRDRTGSRSAHRLIGDFEAVFGRHLRERDEQLVGFLRSRPGGLQRPEWDDSLCTGVAEIDAQHRELFDRADRFFEASGARAGRSEAREALAYLGEYARLHFAREEALMRGLGYPRLGEHQAEHRAYVGRLAAVQERGAGRAPVAALRAAVEGLLRSWLVEHVDRADRLLAAFACLRAH